MTPLWGHLKKGKFMYASAPQREAVAGGDTRIPQPSATGTIEDDSDIEIFAQTFLRIDYSKLAVAEQGDAAEPEAASHQPPLLTRQRSGSKKGNLENRGFRLTEYPRFAKES
jgi:hypothetical protein